jgi:phytanoyl-CoA hydroxylase
MFSRLFRSSKQPEQQKAVTPPPQFFSRYGGLWIDQLDFDEQFPVRLKSGKLTAAQAEQVTFFVKNGYLIIPGAVPASACDRFSDDITNAWHHGDERLLVQRPGERTGAPLTAGAPRVMARVVDSYVYYESALDLLLSDSISKFLKTIFDDDPLLFQSLSFDVGSEQGLHQDTAYVVTSSPMELAAAWIALEDIQEGSGELMYVPGSHRFPEFHFSGQYKHWNPERDGDEQQRQWSRHLDEETAAMGLKREVFRPRKGDVLIWSADLAHGGSPVSDRSLSRKSLVGHYCPNRVDPNYFSYRNDRLGKKRYRNGFYSSNYYDVTAAPQKQ